MAEQGKETNISETFAAFERAGLKPLNQVDPAIDTDLLHRAAIAMREIAAGVRKPRGYASEPAHIFRIAEEGKTP